MGPIALRLFSSLPLYAFLLFFIFSFNIFDRICNIWAGLLAQLRPKLYSTRSSSVTN